MCIFLRLFLFVCVSYCVGEVIERFFGDYFDYELPKFSSQYYEEEDIDIAIRGRKTTPKHAPKKKHPAHKKPLSSHKKVTTKKHVTVKKTTKATTTKKKTTTKKPTTTTTRTRITGPHALDHTFFSSLSDYAVQATPVPESTYPWVARVVHSRHPPYPYVCTASCIEPRIFITSARCLSSLKVSTTSVIFHDERYPAQVFVVPSNPTKQLFDDIGIIVVEGQRSDWPTLKMFDGKRTDNDFNWFDKLKTTSRAYKAIGYVTDKMFLSVKTAETEFKLHELDVQVDIYACEQIFSKHILTGYFVPCYHSCTSHEFKRRQPKCQKYLGTEGGVLYDVKDKLALGISTWGAMTNLYELPVGISVPNSDAFYADLKCAQRIRDDTTKNAAKGYYQKLCT